MLLRNVICLRAWVDLYHITFGISQIYHNLRKQIISHRRSRYITKMKLCCFAEESQQKTHICQSDKCAFFERCVPLPERDVLRFFEVGKSFISSIDKFKKICYYLVNRTKEVFYLAKFCSNCGTPLEENQKFCTECGSPVARANNPQEPQIADKKAPVTPPSHPMPQYTYQPPKPQQPQTVRQPQVPQTPVNPPAQKKKKSKAWIFVVLLLAIVAFFGFRDGGWFRKKNVSYSDAAMISLRDYARQLEKAGNTAAAEAVYEQLARGGGAEIINDAHDDVPIIGAIDEAAQFDAFANTVKGGGR